MDLDKHYPFDTEPDKYILYMSITHDREVSNDKRYTVPLLTLYFNTSKAVIMRFEFFGAGSLSEPVMFSLLNAFRKIRAA